MGQAKEKHVPGGGRGVHIEEPPIAEGPLLGGSHTGQGPHNPLLMRHQISLSLQPVHALQQLGLLQTISSTCFSHSLHSRGGWAQGDGVGSSGKKAGLEPLYARQQLVLQQITPSHCFCEPACCLGHIWHQTASHLHLKVASSVTPKGMESTVYFVCFTLASFVAISFLFLCSTVYA